LSKRPSRLAERDESRRALWDRARPRGYCAPAHDAILDHHHRTDGTSPATPRLALPGARDAHPVLVVMALWVII